MAERTYTIRGQLSGASTQHQKIQLAWYDRNYLYQINEFKVYPDSTDTVGSVFGVLSKGKDDTIDPTDWNIEDESIVAFSQNVRYQRVPPGAGELYQIYKDDFIDYDNAFGYDLWVHTNSSNSGQNVNYYIKISKIKIKGNASIVNDLDQYALNIRGA